MRSIRPDIPSFIYGVRQLYGEIDVEETEVTYCTYYRGSIFSRAQALRLNVRAVSVGSLRPSKRSRDFAEVFHFRRDASRLRTDEPDPLSRRLGSTHVHGGSSSQCAIIQLLPGKVCKRYEQFNLLCFQRRCENHTRI